MVNDTELAEAITAQKWRGSQEAGPHQYFLKWDNMPLWSELVKRIREQGQKGEHLGKTYRYYYFDGFKYWGGYGPVLNRARQDQPQPSEA